MNRTDLSAANLLSSTPRFLSNEHLFSAPSAGIPGHQPLFESALLDRIFADLRSLSQIKSAKRFCISGTSGAVSYSDQVYHLQAALFMLSKLTSNITQIDKCCCLAALIYIESALSDMSFQSRSVEKVVDRLCETSKQVITIEMLHVPSNQRFALHKALWFLTVGCIASEGTLNWEPFVEMLGIANSWTGSQAISYRQGLFENILWESSWNQGLPQLWNAIDNLAV
jgi:hypothetical protein